MYEVTVRPAMPTPYKKLENFRQSSSHTMTLVQCCDSDGWQWASRERDFDLSLCAEEGFILTSFLAILVVAAPVRFCLLSYAAGRDISRKSRWRLWAKLVSLFRWYLARADPVFRHFLVWRS